MADKYRLTDKFLVIAASLSPDTADSDAAEFARVKKVRDEFLHGQDIEPPFPTAAIQALAKAYLRRHLTGVGDLDAMHKGPAEPRP